MRISDWSSDVCSSDLHQTLDRPDARSDRRRPAMTQNQAPIVKAARADDVDALLAMARAAQPGMTNLPADPETLAAMLTASVARMKAADGGTGDTAALWFLAWPHGAAIGAGAIFPNVCAACPCYSSTRDPVRHGYTAWGRRITPEKLG